VAIAEQTRVRTCHLLYYGPAGVGKRENLGVIHRTIPPESRVALQADDPERQIAFQFRKPGEEPWRVVVRAMDTGAESVTAAGAADGAPFDGVVFTIDSSAARLDESLAAFESLKMYLENFGLDLMDVPIVLQYNRRNSPDALSVDRLESLLNPWGMLAFPADSAQGGGVRETLRAVLAPAVNNAAVRRARPAAPPTSPQEGRAGDLQLVYGPPVPGTEVTPETAARGRAILKDLNPPIVVPVRIPRHLIEGRDHVRVQLEIELTDDERY